MDMPSDARGIINCRPHWCNQSLGVIYPELHFLVKQLLRLVEIGVQKNHQKGGGEYMKIKTHVRGGPKAR
jgi:hypothetical protein